MLPPGSAEFARLFLLIELIRDLLDAPVSVILIVAGIAFLSVAIVGEIPRLGIDPGERYRNFGLIIGSVVLIIGLGIHLGMPIDDPEGPTDGDPTPTSAPPSETLTPTPAPPTDTLTPPPAPPTETLTPTPSLASFSFPKGFDESGFTDPDRAVGGHVRAISLQSFQATLIYWRGGSRARFDISADPETHRVHKIWRENGSIQSELYYDSGVVQARTPGSRGFNSEDVPSFAAAALLEGQFDYFYYSKLSEPEVLRTQGRTAVSYIVTSERDDHEGDLIVAENGLFIDYNLRIQGDGFVQYHITNIGNTTVEEPNWVD